MIDLMKRVLVFMVLLLLSTGNLPFLKCSMQALSGEV